MLSLTTRPRKKDRRSYVICEEHDLRPAMYLHGSTRSKSKVRRCRRCPVSILTVVR